MPPRCLWVRPSSQHKITSNHRSGNRRIAGYIASQLRASRVEPGVNGSYFQDVPIDIVGAGVSSITIAASGKATSSLQWDDSKDVDVKGAAAILFLLASVTVKESSALAAVVVAPVLNLIARTRTASDPLVRQE